MTTPMCLCEPLQTCLCELRREQCELRRKHSLVQSSMTADGVTSTVFTKGWSELTGMTHEQLEMGWLDAVHPDDRDECEMLWQKAVGGTPQQFDFRIRRKDGKYSCLLADIVSVASGIVGTFIDISKRKSLQVSAQNNHDLVSLVTDSLHAMIAYVGVDQRYIYVNRGYSEFWEVPRREIVGKHMLEVLGDNFSRIESHLNQAIQGQKQRFEVTMGVNGKAQRVSASVVPHFEDGGKVKGIFLLDEPLNDIMHSHFEDLERFMDHWQDDPLGFCNFTGRAVARIGNRNFSDLFFAIGTSYFAFHCLPDRIDHLYSNHGTRIGGVKGKTIQMMVEIDLDDNVICLRDKSGRHKNIELMLWRQVYEGYLTYFLRPDGNFDDCDSWNFRRPNEITDGVIVYPEARGFYDPSETKSVADLIVLASNLTGFVGCEC